jgi:hypothetical protein
MQKLILSIAVLAITVPLPAQVLQFSDLNTRDFSKLDKGRTVVIIPGGIFSKNMGHTCLRELTGYSTPSWRTILRRR